MPDLTLSPAFVRLVCVSCCSYSFSAIFCTDAVSDRTLACLLPALPAAGDDRNDSEETLELIQKTRQKDEIAMERLGDICCKGGEAYSPDRNEALAWYAGTSDPGNLEAR